MVPECRVFHEDFNELTDSCVSFYEENKKRMQSEHVRERRAELSRFVEAFHKECGTLTASVKERIKDLRSGNCIVLMTAHQPNFFAYSGVMRKATLSFVLAKRLEERLEVPVVNFFGIADQDFTDDRWVRSCQLPSVRRTGGLLPINVKLPEKLMLNKVGKVSPELLEEWRTEIEKWLNDAITSAKRLSKSLGLSEVCSASCVSALRRNFAAFWSVVKDCFERSGRFSDFNAFVMSKIVNEAWKYDTVFARFSECQRAFVGEFVFLLSHFSEYSRLLREAMEKPGGESVGGGVSDQEFLLAPFWYHCGCGSKAKLFVIEKGGSLFGEGRCVGCDELHELEFGSKDDVDLSDFALLISARAIPMGLVFFNGLMPSCYVGGAGGARYLMEAEHVADGLAIPFPPVAVWRPHDEYSGVGQAEALLELKRICNDLGVQDISAAKDLLESRIYRIRQSLDDLEKLKKSYMEQLRKNPNDEKLKKDVKRVSVRRSELARSSNLSVLSRDLKILENVSAALNLVPSIIDYAVSIGLKETSDQWIKHLCEDGSLSSDVHLDSVLKGVGLDPYFVDRFLFHTKN